MWPQAMRSAPGVTEASLEEGEDGFGETTEASSRNRSATSIAISSVV